MTNQTAAIPAAALRGRELYAAGVPTAAIMAETKLTVWQLYNWIEGRATRDGEQLLPPLPKRRVTGIRGRDRRLLVARMMRSAERQVAEIELRVGSPQGEREKDARTLAILARTMRDLSALDARDRELEEKAKETGQDNGNGNSAERPVPRDLDELRRSISRKLQQIVAERAEPPAGEL